MQIIEFKSDRQKIIVPTRKSGFKKGLLCRKTLRKKLNSFGKSFTTLLMFLASKYLLKISLLPGKWLIFWGKKPGVVVGKPSTNILIFTFLTAKKPIKGFSYAYSLTNSHS